jgi:tRNA (guanine37-N1)-methyltransferase
MRIDVVSIFPEYLDALAVSLVGKAADVGILDLHVHDLRNWAHDIHRSVDDSPYGGGAGMVMTAPVWGEALDAVLAMGERRHPNTDGGGVSFPDRGETCSSTAQRSCPGVTLPDARETADAGQSAGTEEAAGTGETTGTGETADAGQDAGTGETTDAGRAVLVIPSPAGFRFTQAEARRLARARQLVFACGRYEGIDQRVADHYAGREGVEVRELSIGDYVIAGGEAAVLVIVEAVARLLPGVIGNPASLVEESHADALLEYPLYTRPESWRGLDVPPMLLSGHHARIAEWRRAQSMARTAQRRPDLLPHPSDE